MASEQKFSVSTEIALVRMLEMLEELRGVSAIDVARDGIAKAIELNRQMIVTLPAISPEAVSAVVRK